MTSSTALNDSLNQVLADSYGLMALTHLAHWNVASQDLMIQRISVHQKTM